MLTEIFLTPVNVIFLKVTYLDTLSRCLMKYTANIKLLSALVFTLNPGSSTPVALTPTGWRITLQIFLIDSSSRDLNSSIELIAWSLYIDDDVASFQPRCVSIALQATLYIFVAVGEISHGYTI